MQLLRSFWHKIYAAAANNARKTVELYVKEHLPKKIFT